MSPGDPRHGTANGYMNQKCRCVECKRAVNEYRKEGGWNVAYRRRLGMKPRKLGRTHGLRSTYKVGCRCSECRESERVYRANYRAGRRGVVNLHRVVPVSKGLDDPDDGPKWRCEGCGAVHGWPDEFEGECPQAQLGLGEAS